MVKPMIENFQAQIQGQINSAHTISQSHQTSFPSSCRVNGNFHFMLCLNCYFLVVLPLLSPQYVSHVEWYYLVDQFRHLQQTLPVKFKTSNQVAMFEKLLQECVPEAIAQADRSVVESELLRLQAGMQDLDSFIDNFKLTQTSYDTIEILFTHVNTNAMLPVLDLFRLVILHPAANSHYSQSQIIPALVSKALGPCTPPIPVTIKIVALRLATNMFTHSFGVQHLTSPDHSIKVVRAAISGLDVQNSACKVVCESSISNTHRNSTIPYAHIYFHTHTRTSTLHTCTHLIPQLTPYHTHTQHHTTYTHHHHTHTSSHSHSLWHTNM